MRMNPEIKKRWTDALRSGNYKQTKGRLRDRQGYCCLGVLCEIAVEDGVVGRFEDRFVAGRYDYGDPNNEWEREPSVLPDTVAKWAGMPVDGGGYVKRNPDVSYGDRRPSLADLNDGEEDREPLTFAEIAELIDKQL